MLKIITLLLVLLANSFAESGDPAVPPTKEDYTFQLFTEENIVSEGEGDRVVVEVREGSSVLSMVIERANLPLIAAFTADGQFVPMVQDGKEVDGMPLQQAVIINSDPVISQAQLGGLEVKTVEKPLWSYNSFRAVMAIIVIVFGATFIYGLSSLRALSKNMKEKENV